MDKIDLQFVDLVPKFIRRDRNGYALSKAIAWAVEQLCADIEQADAYLTDPERMPEWALDEFAYNHGMEWYDKMASVEVKRRWVRDADYMRYVIGTKEAVRHLLLGFYNYVSLEEWYQYDGPPFVFRVFVSGDTDEALEEWGKRATNIVKNLRSIFGAFAQTNRESLNFAQRDSFYLITYGFPDTSPDREQDIDSDAIQTAYYHADRLNMATEDKHLFTRVRETGDAGEIDMDEVQEGQYDAIMLDARTSNTLAYSDYRVPGDMDVGFGKSGLDVGTQDAAGYAEHRVTGDADAGFGVTGLKAGVRHEATLHVYQMTGDAESAEVDVGTGSHRIDAGAREGFSFSPHRITGDADTGFGDSKLDAQTKEVMTVNVYRVTGDTGDADADAETAENTGDMCTGDQWRVGFIDLLFCGNPDAL